MKQQVCDWAREVGFDLVGIADVQPATTIANYNAWIDRGLHAGMQYLHDQRELREQVTNLLPEARSALVVGLNYHQNVSPKEGYPRIAQYALGRDYHKVMRGKLQLLGRRITDHDSGSKWRACVDSAPVLEREMAMRAGLGWIGKNTCMINTHRGSWYFIGVLLLSLDLEPDEPAVGSCGTCTLCIDACPTGAIVPRDDRWQIDSSKCISYLTIEHKGAFSESQQELVGDWTFGCDICQDVCPFNKAREAHPLRATETTERDFLQRREWPSLKELGQIDYDKWDELTRGSPLRRAGFDGLRRNARANIANALKE